MCLADLIPKLLSRGKQLLAVKFVFEFQLTDKFPPVPLLKAYLKESKKVAKKVCREGKNSLKALVILLFTLEKRKHCRDQGQTFVCGYYILLASPQNEATAKEVGAMKSVIKVIEDYKLDSEYPREVLEKQIEHLEKQKADRKRPAAKLQQSNKQKQHQQSGHKRPRSDAPAGVAALLKTYGAVNSISSFPSYQHSLLPATGLLSDGPAPLVSSSAAPYGMSGLTPPIAPYSGSSAGLYAVGGARMSLSGNPSGDGSLVYSSEPYVASGYYDRPTAYDGYGGLPSQYHPSYYPQ